MLDIICIMLLYKHSVNDDNTSINTFSIRLFIDSTQNYMWTNNILSHVMKHIAVVKSMWFGKQFVNFFLLFGSWRMTTKISYFQSCNLRNSQWWHQLIILSSLKVNFSRLVCDQVRLLRLSWATILWFFIW